MNEKKEYRLTTHFPKKTMDFIDYVSKTTNKPKAEIVRTMIEDYIIDNTQLKEIYEQ